MDYLVVSVVAFTTAILTLFSGFGLGTLMLPAYALFLPLPMAVAATAIVHGANNLLKVSLLYRSIHVTVLLRFGVAAVFAAFVGAVILVKLAESEQLFQWSVFQWSFSTTVLKLSLGSLILIFAFIELSGLKKSYQFSMKWLPLGGLISGFFGGLSGHQGAFRSMFLLKAGLEPKQFIATQAIIAFAVDVARLLVYLLLSIWLSSAPILDESLNVYLVICGVIAAFLGTLIGKRFIEKTTMNSIRWITSILLLVIGFGLVSGVI